MTGEVRLYDILGPKTLPWRWRHTVVFLLVSTVFAVSVFFWRHYRKRENRSDDRAEEATEVAPSISREAFEKQIDTLTAEFNDEDYHLTMAKLYECTILFVASITHTPLETVSAEELELYRGVLSSDVIDILQELYTPVFSLEERQRGRALSDRLKNVLYAFYQSTKLSSSTSVVDPWE